MDWIDVATLTVRREFRPGTREKLSGELEPCFDLHRDCGLGCTCDASIWFRDGKPTVDAAESKCLCFNDRKKQGVSEIKGTGRAIKEGPDEWIYEVQAKLVEARQNAKAVGLDAAGGQSHTSDGLCGAGDTEKET